EHTTRISRSAPDQLRQATSKSRLRSLAKEGWTRHSVNGPVPLTGADGVVRSTSNHRCLNEPPRLRPLRRLRRFFLMGAATTPLPRRGVFAPKTRQMSKLQTRAKARDYNSIACPQGAPRSSTLADPALARASRV